MKRYVLPLIVIAAVILMGCGNETETISINKRPIDRLLKDYEEWKEGKGANNCKEFTAYAASHYYGVEMLKEENQYLEYHDIYDFVSSSSAWSKLGDADEQSVADQAQEYANNGVPVVAINTDDEYKLVVLIIEGEQTTSSKWGIKVPNAAAFFPQNGPEPFINKTLNYAWSSPEGIELWVRK